MAALPVATSESKPHRAIPFHVIVRRCVLFGLVAAAIGVGVYMAIPRGPLLHGTAIVGDINEAKRLLGQGANVDAVDDHGHATALGVAAGQGHLEYMKFLVEQGADVNKESPLYYAASTGRREAVALLLSWGADPNRYLLEGLPSPVVAAVRGGHVDVLKLLVDKGAHITAPKSQIDLVREAAVYGKRDMVVYLLSMGLSFDKKDEMGRTPLWWAAFFGHPEVVRILAEKGADVKAQDNQRKTPAQAAASEGHPEVAELLRSLGG